MSPSSRRCPKCNASFPEGTEFCPKDGSALGPDPDATDPRIGQLLDRYRLVERIGEGGMGVVYRAEHTLLGRAVALKLLHPEQVRAPEMVDRFLREARATSEIESDHVVRVTDFGRTKEHECFLVMELLSGRSLKQLVQQQPLAGPRAVRIAIQIAEALAAAHEKGVIHRDLKPGNIQLLEREGDPDYVKLFDFGVAKIMTGADLTQTGMVVGSPTYMSPEQASGKPVDHRADVYALGTILYEMLVGSPPFIGDNPPQIALAQIHQQPTPPHELQPGLSPALEAIVLRCLAKDPEERPASMAELRSALQQWLESTDGAAAVASLPTGTQPALRDEAAGLAPTVSAMGPASRTQAVVGPRRRWRWIALALGVLIAAASLAAYLVVRGGTENVAPVIRDGGPAVAVVGRKPSSADRGIAPSRGPDAAPATASQPTTLPAEDEADEESEGETLSEIPDQVPAPDGKPEVVLLSTPEGAEVFDGERRLGVTPLTLSSETPMELTLKLAGHQPFRLKVSRDATGILNAELTAVQPQPQPRARVKRRKPRRRRRRRRVHSISRLRSLYRRRKISRGRYRRLVRKLARERKRRIATIARMYRARKLSRARYKRYVRAINRYYR